MTNARPALEARKRRATCPSCRKRRTFVQFFTEWYGWATTCLGCGEEWVDTEMLPRPFCPGWRKANVAKAKKHWKEANRYGADLTGIG